MSAVECGSHTGTHVDAPSHTEPEGPDIDAYDVGRFAFEAAPVDLSGREPRSRIRAADLPSSDVDALVLRTG